MKARITLAAAVLLALVALQPAYAGKPVPFDGPAVGGLNLSAPLPTGLFALGSVDLSSFGVADSELATVGPQASAAAGRPAATC